MKNQESADVSTQAKLLARHLREKKLASLTHSQALEALAHAQNVKSYNVLRGALKGQAPAVANPLEEAKALLRQAIALGLNVGDALTVYAENRSPVEKLYLQAAQDQSKDGELEFDDNAIVSLGDDKGAYVMGWSWVALGDLPLPENAAIAFGLPFEAVGIDVDDCRFQKVKIEDLDLNEPVLAAHAQGEVQAADLWLVRSKERQGAMAFELTVADFQALKPLKDCYEGERDRRLVFLEFYDYAD